MRYRAEVEYDGTDYFGSQRQREEPTIQSELEQAIYLVAAQDTSVDFAGRTDAGAHAFGQVIAFDLDWNHSYLELFRALNAKLPAAIALRNLSEASVNFHPRFEAVKRTYQYNIYNSPVRSPHKRLHSWHVTRSLSTYAMNKAANMLIGLHDFAAFGTPPQGSNSVREVFAAEWLESNDCLVFNIEANAFLKRMVRSLVGSLKLVGDGSWTVDKFEAVFKSADRSQAGQTAPACGLFLMSVNYDADNLGE